MYNIYCTSGAVYLYYLTFSGQIRYYSHWLRSGQLEFKSR